MSDFVDSLKGRTVEGVDVSEGEEALRFRCVDGPAVVWVTSADCCSETWWADAFSLNGLRGAMVRDVRHIDLPDYDVNDGRGRQEEDEAYGIRIETEQGVTALAFRNSSNGYYGGWADVGTDGEQWKWRPIFGNDWSA